MRNNFKTLVLMAGLGALFVMVGTFVGGNSGAIIALGFAALLNMGMYFFSAKIALASAKARPVEERELPNVYSIVRSLTQRENLPMPGIYLIDSPQPNAFATGRSPKHAAVAVTTGILQMMDYAELEGVLAHELSHVRNRDILISSIAATVAAALSILMRLAFWTGMGRDRRNDPISGIVTILAFILAPLAAMVIQMAISRSREYEADRSGATITGSPLALARALEKLEAGTRQIPMQVSPSTAQLFIADPLKAFGRRSGGMGTISRWFSTHPPISERIDRLSEMAGGIR
ncbi:MAG: zinc metalloprotease HtpX [Actinobacteria bacterium]|nr:zinc metalloprotease HtpX [Actinomycetota bacterium]MBU1494540.1 zinc metalloprotease HtpX [Actinomycetota bacterium]